VSIQPEYPGQIGGLNLSAKSFCPHSRDSAGWPRSTRVRCCVLFSSNVFNFIDRANPLYPAQYSRQARPSATPARFFTNRLCNASTHCSAFRSVAWADRWHRGRLILYPGLAGVFLGVGRPLPSRPDWPRLVRPIWCAPLFVIASVKPRYNRAAYSLLVDHFPCVAERSLPRYLLSIRPCCRP